LLLGVISLRWVSTAFATPTFDNHVVAASLCFRIIAGIANTVDAVTLAITVTIITDLRLRVVYFRRVSTTLPAATFEDSTTAAGVRIRIKALRRIATASTSAPVDNDIVAATVGRQIKALIQTTQRIAHPHNAAHLCITALLDLRIVADRGSTAATATTAINNSIIAATLISLVEALIQATLRITHALDATYLPVTALLDLRIVSNRRGTTATATIPIDNGIITAAMSTKFVYRIRTATLRC
jgi:hypothetical protein